MSKEKGLLQLIKDALRGRIPEVIEDRGSLSKHAAVLVPLFRQDLEYQILFTKRTNKVEAHKGQISFPGGRVDEGDGSFLETALREAFEEIGLRREDVEMIGQTDDTRTMISNYIVHPFVGLIPYPYTFTMNKDEVEKIMSVPFDVFLLGSSMLSVDYEGTTYESPAYEYGGEVIWGATARIMNNLVRIMRARSQRAGA